MENKHLIISVAGKEISFETGKIANQANGSVVLKSGDTVILATACGNKEASDNIDFFPLRVDYQEKFSSAGKTLGGFIKREGKQSEKETLVSRLIDRPLRPLFPEGYYNEVQVLSYVLSYDENHPPEPLAICAASAALLISDIPFTKPVGAVRVGMIDNDFIINPTLTQQAKSKLDLIIAGTQDAILMIEGYCDFLTEEEVLLAIDTGHKAIQYICQNLIDWQNIVGKEKQELVLRLPPESLVDDIEKQVSSSMEKALEVHEKAAQYALFDIIEKEAKESFLVEGEERPYTEIQFKQAFKTVKSKVLRKKILGTKKRADGRGPSDIRPISVETSLLPRTHGSVLFTRGETQSLAVCTLGGETMGQRYEELSGEGIRKFYLQYSFPPFSVGEVGKSGPPGRREIGHGKLAERALQAILPDASNKFPYTIRIESNITACNGSSSMASVCGGCLAMMDAGVPIKRAVSGIAMGLILEGHSFIILSDILGIEDALGDMDFKVTGDANGITAFQMDIKVEGITQDIMKSALAQAKEGRIHILHKMLEVCPKPKAHLSPYAPRIETMTVKSSKIAIVIGPGGKTIRSIIEETGAEIDINDDGVINIAAIDASALEKAKAMIYNLTAEVEENKVYKGPVVSIQPFGAFVRLPGAKDGLCHISELSHERVGKVEDILKIGDEIEVKVLEINDRGQIKLSRKVLLPKPVQTG